MKVGIQSVMLREQNPLLRATRGLDAVYLSVRFDIHVDRNPRGGVTNYRVDWCDVPIRVRTSSGKIHILSAAASARESRTMFIPMEGTDHVLEYCFSMTYTQLGLLDTELSGGDFELNIQPLADVARGKLLEQVNFGRLCFDVSYATWATMLQDVWSDSAPNVYIGLTVPGLDPGASEALEYLRRASQARMAGRHEQCVEICRKVIETVRPILKPVTKPQVVSGEFLYGSPPMKDSARLLATSVFKYACPEVHHGPETGSSGHLESGTALAGSTAAVFAALRYGLWD